MGNEKSKITPKDKWEKILLEDFAKNLPERQLYYLGWEYDGALIGHSNINKIAFGSHANVHLHIMG